MNLPESDHKGLKISFPLSFDGIFTCTYESLAKLEALPSKKFLLIHTGRCGSTLLHHLIMDYFCPPFEIFNDVKDDEITKKNGFKLPIDIAEYISAYRDLMFEDIADEQDAAILSISLTPWQLYGLHEINPSILAWLFKDSVVTVLLRRNIVKQALSHAAASQSKNWHRFQETPPPPENSITQLARALLSGSSRDKPGESSASPTHEQDPPSIQSVREYLDLILWAESTFAKEPMQSFIPPPSRASVIYYEDLIESQEVILQMVSEMNRHNRKPSSSFAKRKVPMKQERSEPENQVYNSLMDSFPFALNSRCIYRKNEFYSRYTGDIS